MTTNQKKESNHMKLKQLGSNQTQISIGTNKVLFSYETPVAMMDISGQYFVTDKKWSRTTSKHINKWIGNTCAQPITKSQTFFDNLLNEVK